MEVMRQPQRRYWTSKFASLFFMNWRGAISFQIGQDTWRSGVMPSLGSDNDDAF